MTSKNKIHPTVKCECGGDLEEYGSKKLNMWRCVNPNCRAWYRLETKTDEEIQKANEEIKKIREEELAHEKFLKEIGVKYKNCF